MKNAITITLLLCICLLTSSTVAKPGESKKLGNRDWSSIHAMIALGDKLYVGDSPNWWIVDKGGVAKPFKPKWNDGWGGTARMTTLNGKIYCVNDTVLYEVDPGSGSVKKLTPEWHAVLGMAAWDNRLYIISSNELYEVEPTTGVYKSLSENWHNVGGLVSLDGKLYALHKERLVEVDKQGNTKEIDGIWNSASRMVATDGKLYIVTSQPTPQGPLLNEWVLDSFDPKSGKRTRLAWPQGWERGAGVHAMAASDGKLFMVSGSGRTSLFSLDVK